MKPGSSQHLNASRKETRAGVSGAENEMSMPRGFVFSLPQRQARCSLNTARLARAFGQKRIS